MNRIASFVLLAGILTATAAQASSSNPPDFYLNTSGVVSCTACHRGSEPNTGGGSLKIEGLPAQYTPGEKYTVRVTISHPGFKKWGFMLSAMDAAGKQAGQFISNDPQIDLKTSFGVTFVKQSFNGTDSLGASRSWTFQWKAPATGNVTISAQGLAADGSNNSVGDFTYTASQSISAGAAAAATAD